MPKHAQDEGRPLPQKASYEAQPEEERIVLGSQLSDNGLRFNLKLVQHSYA